MRGLETISLAVCAMKLSILSLLSLLAVGANAHCEYLYLVIISCGKYADHVVHLVTMQYIWVNGADQGQNVDIRVPPNNNPVTDVTSTDITCNVNGLSGAGVSTATIPAGATVSFFALLHHFLCSPITSSRQITFEWHQHAQRTGEDPISGGHKGPVQVYIAKAPSSAASFDGQGPVWTKIYSSGLVDASSQEWATDVVNANGGKHSVTIPASLPAGDYLLRAEIVSNLFTSQ